MLAIAILMKDPAQSKSRLSPVLGADARQGIALLMFESALGFFSRNFAGSALCVVTPSGRIVDLALTAGAAVLQDDGAGINAAAAQAVNWAQTIGASSLLILHADIPVLERAEIEALISAGKDVEVAIAVSADGGTNAVLLTPPNAISTRFGKGSADAHARAAQDAGRTFRQVFLPHLSRDIDRPEDLRAMMETAAPAASSHAIAGLPEVQPGDDLGTLIVSALDEVGISLLPGDIIAVAQKIVSKAEGRFRRLADFAPSSRALAISHEIGKDARKVEAVLSESTDVVRAMRMGADGLLITRHKQGWICANAGIDESNLGPDREGMLLLLPEDADRSARAIRQTLEGRFTGPIGVIVTDTFGRPWRHGLVNTAIGVAGVPAIVDWAGKGDAYGRALKATQPAFADEIAAAAGLLMGKDAGLPVVLMRGLDWVDDPKASARDVLRPIAQELFL